MLNRLKVFVHSLIPPAGEKFLLRMGFSGITFKYGYENWQTAASVASGYQNIDFYNELVQSSRTARDSETKFERDGVLFDEPQPSWPLLASLLATPGTNNALRILDIGGALGTTYRQNRNFLKKAELDLEWMILEQAHIAEAGMREFSNTELSFISDLKIDLANQFDAVIFASSICYFPDPTLIIDQVKNLKPSRIIFDRTPISKKPDDQIGVQKVRLKTYKTNYPIRTFGTNSIERLLNPEYELIESWICDLQPDPRSTSKGFFFARVD